MSSSKGALEYLQEGNCAAALGDFSLAIDCFSQGLSLASQSAGLFLNRSIAYERLSNYQEAFADLRQYLQFVQSDPEQNLLALKRFIALGLKLNQSNLVLKCLQDLELLERWQSTHFYEALISLIALDSVSLESSLPHYLQRATSLGMLNQLSFENALSMWQLHHLAKSNEISVGDLLIQLAMQAAAPQFVLHGLLDWMTTSITDQETLAEQSIGILSLWVQIHPMDASATERLIQYLIEKNQVDLVETLFLELSKRYPKEPNYLMGLAKARFFKRDLERAFVVINAALDLDEKNIEIRLERARIFEQLLNPHLALVDLNQNLKLDPHHLPSCIAKAGALADLGRLDEALELQEQLMALDLNEEERLSLEFSRSFTYRVAGKIDEWFVHTNELAKQYPDRPEVLCELAWKEIYQGNWQKGFGLLEHRFDPGVHYFPVQPHLDFAKIPKWTKELLQSSVEGKHLLLCGEEGMGDVIQFSRFIPLLLDKGLRITFMCKEPLHSLLAYNFPQIRIVSPSELIKELHEQSQKDGRYNLYGEIMSIPWLLELSINDLSGEPYLKAMPEKIDHMAAFKKSKLANQDGQFTIGLRWISSMARSGRSIPLEDLQLLAQLPISIFGLHYGPITQADQQLYESWPNFYPTELELDDLAGFMMNLDYIVTTDTMTAHLAGALGRPTIMLKPVFIDWRWSDTSSQSIWYDSMRLIRQDKIRDWRGAIERLVLKLRQWIQP